MDASTLVEIIERAQRGDHMAQQQLYLDSGKSVYYLALKILKNEDDAEDITQDVFVTVFNKISSLKQPITYYKWLNQIASNKCLNFLHKKRPLSSDEQTIVNMMELEESDVATPESLYDDAETRRIIVEIIDALPDVQRISIMYRYFNQFSIEEIAQMTNTNVFTVKNRLALAMLWV